MKISYAMGLVATSVLITVAIEETRIASLRKSINTERTAAAERAPLTPVTVPREAAAAPLKTKSRSELAPATPAKESDTTEESLAKTARKMWDNPAGKSMMNQGVKMAVAMMYQDFVDGLNLSKEEGDYFKNLLGKEMADQQELGMKMLGATSAEQKALAKELEKRGEENKAEIKKFLNSDEDFKSFTDYKNHLPERQQLDGIRSAMSSKGAPLTPEKESKLVDAMYRARTESKAPDLSGPSGLEALAKGSIVETFENSWDSQQKTLRGETANILDETQRVAFEEYQKQMKEMQLMSLKMAEKMMPKEISEDLAAPEKKVDFK